MIVFSWYNTNILFTLWRYFPLAKQFDWILVGKIIKSSDRPSLTNSKNLFILVDKEHSEQKMAQRYLLKEHVEQYFT